MGSSSDAQIVRVYQWIDDLPSSAGGNGAGGNRVWAFRARMANASVPRERRYAMVAASTRHRMGAIAAPLENNALSGNPTTVENEFYREIPARATSSTR